jgi:hypothetical protein
VGLRAEDTALAVNDAAVQHYGYTEAEFLAMTIRGIRRRKRRPRRRVGRRQTTRARDLAPSEDGSIIDVEISSDGVVLTAVPPGSSWPMT